MFRLSAIVIGTLLMIVGIVAVQHSSPPLESNQTCGSDCSVKGPLHVPSPEWRDQIIYFLMIDRFEDGDTSNNDQGAGVYGKGQPSLYNGGDLKGITARLDYIQNLGATAVWTTPHVANQWFDPLAHYWGYHGYWARDFKAVDEHYGTMEDYQDLSRGLHKRGMYLIQDVVVNHMGNFYSYQGPFDEADESKNFSLNPGSLPVSVSPQAPFDQVDFNNPSHRAADIYHWRPNIIDNSITEQEQTYQLSDLDDLNTTNPVVRNALKDSFNFWITQAGVDAIRIDTAKYVEKEFYHDFLHAEDGLLATAKKTGRDHFLSFGEILDTSAPYENNGEEKIRPYLKTEDNAGIESPIGFPLYQDIHRVFASGRATRYLSYRLQAAMEWYPDPFVAVNFIDNHDVERFLASGSLAGFKQAYALLMTVPGIPAIYQGDEQEFELQRQTMFAGGYGSERDQFDQSSSMYQYIQTLTEMRKAHKIFSRGDIQILDDNGTGPGVLAYKREYEGQSAFVIFNTSDSPTIMNRLPTGFSDSNPPQVLFTQGFEQKLVFSDTGALTMELPARSVIVFVGTERQTSGEEQGVSDAGSSVIQVDNMQAEYVNQANAVITGSVSQPGVQLLKVIDGNLQQAEPFTADEQGKWQITLDVNDLGEYEHSLEIYWPEVKEISERFVYRTFSDQTQVTKVVNDPLGDDHGRLGNVIKPSFQQQGCYMDIKAVEARVGDDILELTLHMCGLSRLWGPENGFDHVAVSLFIDLPEQQGNTALPSIGGQFPDGDWDLSHLTYGWGNTLYRANGESKDSNGQLLNVKPTIETDADNKTIRFRYKGQDIGVDSWLGSKIYITTWDREGDGSYKTIAAGEGQKRWKFSGAEPTAEKILDDIVIQL